jgi:uncharacterized membrane protein (UPF0127 family)
VRFAGAHRAGVIGVVALVVVAIGIGAVLLVDHSSGTDKSSGSGPLSAAVARATPAQAPFVGLTEVRLGRCLRLAVADSLDERVAGLRGTTDLGPYDGMIFVFGGESTAAFTMSGVTDPLDIGFYRGDGTRDSSELMKPCARAEADCPVYRAPDPFVYALETPGGQLRAGSLRSCPS